MKNISRIPSSRSCLFAFFLLSTRFTNCRMPCSGLGMEAFGPSRRFSSQLRWSSWCSQLLQKGGHGSSHLRQGQDRASRLPWSIAAHHLRAGQDQEVVRTGNEPRPAFGSLRCPQSWHIPEQFLLVEAIAMLVRLAQPIGRADFGQRSYLFAPPDKPTDFGITSLATSPMTDNLDH